MTGLGDRIADIDRIITGRREQQAKDRAKEADALPANGEIGRGRNRPDNIKANSGHGGTSVDYLTARIARDRPDIPERKKG